jgi:hypothetical protein
MTPTEYERAVMEDFRMDWPSPRFIIKHDIRLIGSKSNSRRQIDISIFETGKAEPLFIIEAKMHKRPVDLIRAGSTIALVQDVGRIPAVMVSTSGFSASAAQHLTSEGIRHFTIALEDANTLSWMPIIKEKFAVKEDFSEIAPYMVKALQSGVAETDAFEHLSYDAFTALMEFGQSYWPKATRKKKITAACWICTGFFSSCLAYADVS